MPEMISVAWQVPNSPNWIGGLNYFCNLAAALDVLPEKKISPVIFKTRECFPPPLSNLRMLEYPAKLRGHNTSLNLKEEKRIRLDNGSMLVSHLMRNNIDVLFSYTEVLGKRSPVPAICWIPDFQHVHFPEFFTPDELAHRDFVYCDVANRAQAVILSSEDARMDYERLFPNTRAKLYVLHFVALVQKTDLSHRQAILDQYNIREPYLHVPNQLWMHKNHGIILDALRILKDKGRAPLVISTGLTNDYRRPNYFSTLKRKIEEAGLAERFRFLGLIPHEDKNIIMRYAVAMINPSLFEGWSTTVEEAKTLGKRIILSNISVHREQNPSRGIFFDPNNPDELAASIELVLDEQDLKTEIEYATAAQAEFPSRLATFGRNYEEIILKITGSV